MVILDPRLWPWLFGSLAVIFTIWSAMHVYSSPHKAPDLSTVDCSAPISEQPAICYR